MEVTKGHCLCGEVTFEFHRIAALVRPLPLRQLPARDRFSLHHLDRRAQRRVPLHRC